MHQAVKKLCFSQPWTTIDLSSIMLLCCFYEGFIGCDEIDGAGCGSWGDQQTSGSPYSSMTLIMIFSRENWVWGPASLFSHQLSTFFVCGKFMTSFSLILLLWIFFFLILLLWIFFFCKFHHKFDVGWLFCFWVSDLWLRLKLMGAKFWINGVHCYLFIYFLCWAVDAFGSCVGIFSVVVDNVILYFVILYIYGNYI